MRWNDVTEREEVYKQVDSIVIEMTDFNGFNFSRSELTVEMILGWLPPEIRTGLDADSAKERAEQWVKPRAIIVHFPDPINSSKTLCGQNVFQLPSLRTAEARHLMLVSGTPSGSDQICAACASKR
jgi:hypothetical protein